MTLEKILKWTDVSRSGADPLDFYNSHYAGLTRGQLTIEDTALYSRLRKDNLLDQIPLSSKQRAVRKIEYPLKYYVENYLGVTRKGLRHLDQSLYKKLLKDGSITNVPLRNIDWENIDWENPSWKEVSHFGIPPVIFYQVHYDGLTKKRLQKKDSALYSHLERKKLLSKILSKEFIDRFQSDPLKYYHENYEGMSRTELWAKDITLYRRLISEKLLDKIPRKKGSGRPCSKKYDDVDAWAYYEEHYNCLTRTELVRIDNLLYRKLKEKGLLERIPKKTGKKTKN